MSKPKRPLTDAELNILRLVQQLYGEQNKPDDVFCSDAGEAVIFVKDTAGTVGLCAVLTNIARESRDLGLTEEQICQRFLIPA